MKVYIIVNSDECNPNVHSVYSTIEKAKEIIKVLEYNCPDGGYYIEEYEVDSEKVDDYYTRISYYTPSYKYNYMKDEIVTSTRQRRDFEEEYYSLDEEKYFSNEIFEFLIPYNKCYTENDLLKIARDRYAQYKAEKENII